MYNVYYCTLAKADREKILSSPILCDCPPHNMLRIQGAVILVLSVLVAVNGLKCYQSCTGSDCSSSDGTATDTAITCDSQYIRCVKFSFKSGSQKLCGAEGGCLLSEALAEAVVELDDGSNPAAVAEAKSYKCYECAGDLCNRATGLYAGAWTAVLASIVALVNVHYQVITLNYGALASVTFGWRCGLMTDMCSSGSMCACMCSVLFDPSILSSFLRARGYVGLQGGAADAREGQPNVPGRRDRHLPCAKSGERLLRLHRGRVVFTH